MANIECPKCGETIALLVELQADALAERGRKAAAGRWAKRGTDARSSSIANADARPSSIPGDARSSSMAEDASASSIAGADASASSMAGPVASAVAKPERAAPPPRQPRVRRPAPPEPPEPPEPDEPQAEPEPAIEEIKPSYPPVCARCCKRMVNWSPIAWRCSGCCRNYPKA